MITKKIRYVITLLIYPIFLFFGFLVPKNKKIIVIEGTDRWRFNDNGKYLFEYLSRETKYSVYWYTNSYDVKLYLESHGYGVIYSVYEKIRILSRARLVIGCGSSFPDFYGLASSNKTIKYCLMHGVGPKLSLYFNDVQMSINEINKINRFNYINFPSEFTKNMIGKVVYKLPNKKICCNGYPRFTYLSKKNISPENIIFYTPTWRLDNSNIVPLLELFSGDLTELDMLLSECNFELLISIHLKQLSLNLKNYKKIRVILPGSVGENETTEILALSKILINDYSTTSVDFSLKNRPQIFIQSDFDNYIENHSFIDDFKTFPGHYVDNKNLFLDTLRSVIYHGDSYNYTSSYLKYTGKIDDSLVQNKLFIDQILNI